MCAPSPPSAQRRLEGKSAELDVAKLIETRKRLPFIFNKSEVAKEASGFSGGDSKEYEDDTGDGTQNPDGSWSGSFRKVRMSATSFLGPPKSPETAEVLLRAINDHFLFGSLEEAARDTILDALVERPMTEGDVLITQGETGDDFYILESGQADVFVDEKHVHTYKAGTSFGDVALLYGCPRTATVTCSTEGVAWSLSRKKFRYVLATYAETQLSRSRESLRNVGLLSKLTDEQLAVSL